MPEGIVLAGNNNTTDDDGEGDYDNASQLGSGKCLLCNKERWTKDWVQEVESIALPRIGPRNCDYGRVPVLQPEQLMSFPDITDEIGLLRVRCL